MFVLYIVSYLDRINISFAGLPMSRQLGFTEEIFGLGGGIFFLGYFLFGIPSNLLVQKIGARRWIATIMVVWGAVSMATASVADATSLYILRFLLGIAEAGFFPGMILYLTYWFPRQERGLAVAKFMSAIPVAGIAGGVIASRLLAMDGLAGLSGWQWLFILTGLPAVLLGIFVWYYLSDSPDTARWLSSSERTVLTALVNRDATADGACAHNGTALGSLKDALVWGYAFVYFTLAFGMYGFQLWLPQIIHKFGGIDDSATALLSSVPAIFQAAGMLAIAWNSDRTGERRRHLSAAAFVAAIGLLASASAPNLPAALTALSVAAFGIWGTVGPFWALPTARVSPRAAAAGIALINSVGNLGGFAGPYLVGMIKSRTGNFGYALGLIAAALVVGAITSLCLASRSPLSPLAETSTDIG
jgi:ACS family tartrate transporter-like MFS transporter